LWAVNLGCLGFHVWPYRADTADADHVDELRLDLDPQPGTGFAEAVEAAFELRALLDEHGITAHPKTTASRGLHVYVRLEPPRPPPTRATCGSTSTPSRRPASRRRSRRRSSCAPSSTSTASPPTRSRPPAEGCTSTCGSSPGGPPTRCGPPPSPSPASSSGGDP